MKQRETSLGEFIQRVAGRNQRLTDRAFKLLGAAHSYDLGFPAPNVECAIALLQVKAKMPKRDAHSEPALLSALVSEAWREEV